jgi:D-tyrosyl-tRNA(Tyr) deacylase
MRLVVQRVEKAKVTLTVANDGIPAGTVVGQIEKGLFVLVGFKKGDSEHDVEVLSDKLLKLRVMSDDKDKMNFSVKDAGASFLLVSQFTLNADTSGGNRPSFINAEDPEKAKKLYDLFVNKIKASGIKTETGSFGGYMKIDCTLDGPVTILY